MKRNPPKKEKKETIIDENKNAARDLFPSASCRHFFSWKQKTKKKDGRKNPFDSDRKGHCFRPTDVPCEFVPVNAVGRTLILHSLTKPDEMKEIIRKNWKWTSQTRTRSTWFDLIIGYYWVLLGFKGFYWVLFGFTGFHWVLLSFTGFYWVLLGFTGFYWVLLSFNGFYWVLMGLTGFYLVSQGFTGFYLVLLGFNGFYWVLLGFNGFYWVLMGFTGFYWVLLGFTGFYWVLLGFTGL